MRRTRKNLLFGTVLTLALANTGWSLAQTGPRTPPQNNTQSTRQAAENPPGLNHEQLGLMLRSMGYEAKERTHSGGTRDYVITVHRGEWAFHVRLAFSPNQRVLWINTNLADIPANGGIPPAVLNTLLTQNGTAIGKAFFRFGHQQILLSMAVDNRDISAVNLRQDLHDFVEAIAMTEQHWNPKRWTAQTTQPAPAPAPAPANDLFGRSR